jgi:hypothetical protein
MLVAWYRAAEPAEHPLNPLARVTAHQVRTSLRVAAPSPKSSEALDALGGVSFVGAARGAPVAGQWSTRVFRQRGSDGWFPGVRRASTMRLMPPGHALQDTVGLFVATLTVGLEPQTTLAARHTRLYHPFEARPDA